MADEDRGLIASYWRLAAFDVANGSGTCTATLRSGAQFTGSVNKELSGRDVLHLNTATGWHTIEYAEIAAMTGER